MDEELYNIIELAAKKYHEKYGEDAKMEEGESQLFLLKNGALILSIDNGQIRVDLIGGEPINVDIGYSIFN